MDDGAELRVEHLDRHVAVVLDVAREIDCRHASASDLTFENVGGTKRILELREDVGHGCPEGVETAALS
ncbi:MAG: hypothetical protein Q7S20_08920 [Gemmatimonadaceae bacterium]|nr:hypothetical protein [Gemmatimonadaceae bacterium]